MCPPHTINTTACKIHILLGCWIVQNKKDKLETIYTGVKKTLKKMRGLMHENQHKVGKVNNR